MEIFYTWTFEEREEFIEEMFRHYIQNANEEMTEGLYEIMFKSPFAIISIKGFLTSGSEVNSDSTVQKANELMV